MTRPDLADPSRRHLLTLGGVVLAAAVAGGRPASAAAPAMDFSAPAQRLKAYMMMRGALDDRLVIGFLSGRYYGVVDNELKPLYGLVAATFARYRVLAGGGYEGVSYEVPYFTDLTTGEVIDQWLNPYTGEQVKVEHGGFPPGRIVIGPDLSLGAPQPMPGMHMVDRVATPLISGDDLWMTEETLTAFQTPGMPRPIRYSEIVTLHARRSDFQPGARRVACQTTYSSVVSWRPWQKMADRPGHLLGTGAGRYGATFDEMPQAWRTAVAARRPEVLKDPGGPLEALWKA